MNEYDSARMADVLRDSGGYQPTEDAAEADLLLLNTCSVREKAQEKVFSLLGQWRLLKHVHGIHAASGAYRITHRFMEELYERQFYRNPNAMRMAMPADGLMVNRAAYGHLAVYADLGAEVPLGEIMRELLATDYGLMLCTPGFVRYDDTSAANILGNPGTKENAGIFNHIQGWAVMAEALRRLGGHRRGGASVGGERRA